MQGWVKQFQARGTVPVSWSFTSFTSLKKTMRFSSMPERLQSLQVAWFSKIGHHMQPMLSQNTAPIKSLPQKSIFNVSYFGLVAFFLRFRHGFPKKNGATTHHKFKFKFRTSVHHSLSQVSSTSPLKNQNRHFWASHLGSAPNPSSLLKLPGFFSPNIHTPGDTDFWSYIPQNLPSITLW